MVTVSYRSLNGWRDGVMRPSTARRTRGLAIRSGRGGGWWVESAIRIKGPVCGAGTQARDVGGPGDARGTPAWGWPPLRLFKHCGNEVDGQTTWRCDRRVDLQLY